MCSVKINDIKLFKDHLVVHEREDGLPKITVYKLPPIGGAIERLQGGRVIDFVDPVYSAEIEASEYSSDILRFSYSSLRTPSSIYDYDMKTGASVLKKIETVSSLLKFRLTRSFSHDVFYFGEMN